MMSQTSRDDFNRRRLPVVLGTMCVVIAGLLGAFGVIAFQKASLANWKTVGLQQEITDLTTPPFATDSIKLNGLQVGPTSRGPWTKVTPNQVVYAYACSWLRTDVSAVTTREVKVHISRVFDPGIKGQGHLLQLAPGVQTFKAGANTMNQIIQVPSDASPYAFQILEGSMDEDGHAYAPITLPTIRLFIIYKGYPLPPALVQGSWIKVPLPPTNPGEQLSCPSTTTEPPLSSPP